MALVDKSVLESTFKAVVCVSLATGRWVAMVAGIMVAATLSESLRAAKVPPKIAKECPCAKKRTGPVSMVPQVDAGAAGPTLRDDVVRTAEAAPVPSRVPVPMEEKKEVP